MKSKKVHLATSSAEFKEHAQAAQVVQLCPVPVTIVKKRHAEF